jgi:hypothetical protein
MSRFGLLAFPPSQHTMKFEVTRCEAPAASDGKTWCWCHLGEGDFSCGPVKAVIPAKAGIQ